MSGRIAVLGWGSLIWNPGGLPLMSDWKLGGPELPIEFSRVSTDGRLTLVIDPDHGVRVPVRYALSARPDLEAAVSDLRERERTIVAHIGFVDTVTGRSSGRYSEVLDTIGRWARLADFDGVVWTDLPENFEEKTHTPFSVENAASYLRKLPPGPSAAAREYLDRAPAEVDTPVRRLAAWLTIQDAIDVCATCQADPGLVPKLPPGSRPWNPNSRGRLLLISEAPPEHGGFWHLPEKREDTRDDLREQIFRLLGSHGLGFASGCHDPEALRLFMSAGFFLIQTLKWPLAKQRSRKGRSFNQLQSGDKARLIDHAVSAHIRAEVSAIAPGGILAMGNAALAACRMLSSDGPGIPKGGVEAVRKSNNAGLEMIFNGSSIPLDVTLLAVDQNMRITKSAGLIEQDVARFLSRHRWVPCTPDSHTRQRPDDSASGAE